MKVGIVGGGQIATVHIPYVRSHAGAEVVGLTDTDEGRAKTTAARFGIANTTRTLAELIERHRPDVVHIVTPPQTHAALAIQAMEAGCHVFVEKPMAVNLEEAEAMEVSIRGATGSSSAWITITCSIRPWFRPRPWSPRAASASWCPWRRSRASRWAPPTTRMSSPAPPRTGCIGSPAESFRTSRRIRCTSLLAFLDPPKTLHAVAQKTGRVPTSFADELRVLVSSDNGLGCFMVSLSIQPFMKYVNLFGTEGSIRVNLSTNSLTVAKNRELPRALARGMLGVDEATQLVQSTMANAYQVARGRLRPYPGMGVLINEFYRCIEENRPSPVDGEAGREVVRILDQVWEQIGRGTGYATVGFGGRGR